MIFLIVDLMKNHNNISLRCLVLLISLILPVSLSASQQAQEGQSKKLVNKTEKTEQQKHAVPGLSNIIPEATALSGRFAVLKNVLNQSPDFSTIEKQYTDVTAALEELIRRFKKLVEHEDENLTKIHALRQAALSHQALLEDIGKPLKFEISRINSHKLQWLSEKARWDDWQSLFLKDQQPEELKQVFKEALVTVESGLDLILKRLDKDMKIQAKGGAAGGMIETLQADINARITYRKQSNLHKKFPLMFSRDYYSQFNSGLWYSILGNFHVISWPGSEYFARHEVAFLFQFLFFMLVFISIYRNKNQLSGSKNWMFISQRPLSSTLLIVISSSMLVFAYMPVQETVKLGYQIVGSIASVRLLGLVIKQPWKKQAAHVVMIVFIVSSTMDIFDLPQTLYRFYVLLVSFIVLLFLYHWFRQNSIRNETGISVWGIRLFTGLFTFISVAEIFGHHGIAKYLFLGTIRSMAILLPYILLIHIIQGVFHWVYFSSPVWQVKLLRSRADYCVQKSVSLFTAGLVGFGLLPALLVVWGLYDDILYAVKSIYSYSFNIGHLDVSVGMVVASVTVFYLAFILSKTLPRVLIDDSFTGRKLARGVQRSIFQLMQYFLIFFGFILALVMLGFDFTKFTIIVSALGVGIGFGLQGIVNNFFCGLILLFERPLTEGDTIEIGTRRAHIKKIGLRATIVETMDLAELIIPNADLINNQVTNWTLNNREVRLSVPVSVAYGSDIPLVVETLLTCATEKKEVVKSPEPKVLFLEFGDSSLDFELRVWILDVDIRLQVKSDLYYQIESKFKELNVVVPFPQRDVHFVSVDAPNPLSLIPDSD